MKLGSVSNRDFLLCTLSVSVGAVVAFATHHGQTTIDSRGFPHWVRVYERVVRATTVFPWNVISLAVLVALFIRVRRGPRAWALAYVTGALLGVIAADALF